MEQEISPRLLDQRLRNRIMEALSMLADGADAVRDIGADEYFESFFDWMQRDGSPWPNETLSSAERLCLLEVSNLMRTAAEATPQFLTDDALIETGWPRRIAPDAKRALDVFLIRGRFDEDREEAEPSSPE